MPSEDDAITATVFGGINAFIALFLSSFYMGLWEILGYFVLIIAIILFLGTFFIAIKIYKVGAILCGIGGAITIPLGILGITAATKAWRLSKWQYPHQETS